MKGSIPIPTLSQAAIPIRHIVTEPRSMTSLSCPTPTSELHQGACVTLDSGDEMYQVIGIDDHHNRCWLRRWPLSRQGSEVFEISLHQVHPIPAHRP